jgi:hypothetical protein
MNWWIVLGFIGVCLLIYAACLIFLGGIPV